MDHTLDIPKVFYDDHVQRSLPAPKIVKELANTYRCKGSLLDWEELRSDAYHYAKDTILSSDYPGLAASARATVKRIDKGIGR